MSAAATSTSTSHRAWHRQLYEAGYVGITWPEEYGGQGRTQVENAILQEELARADAPPSVKRIGNRALWSRPDAPRQSRAAREAPPPDVEGGAHVVPGLLGAGSGIRSG